MALSGAGELRASGRTRMLKVGLSGAGRKSLAHVSRIVEKVRAHVASPPPIVLGGTVCNLGLELDAMTGVDFATTNPPEAMDYCGIRVGRKGWSECEVF